MSTAATSETSSAYFAWGPFIWVAGLHAGAVFAFSPAYFTWQGGAFASSMWLTGGIGICLTYHRLLTHRSFATRPRWLEYVLTALGCCASQGGAVGWVADHRKHHALADLEEDVHSPRRSFAWAYAVWWMTLRSPPAGTPRHTARGGAPDLEHDPVHRVLDRIQIVFPLLMFAGLYVVGVCPGSSGAVSSGPSSSCIRLSWSIRPPTFGVIAVMRPAIIRRISGGWPS